MVMVMRDSDKWRFVQRGDLEPFEEASHYGVTPTSKRLTRPILIRYLQGLGSDVEKDLFWQSSDESVIYSELTKS